MFDLVVRLVEEPSVLVIASESDHKWLPRADERGNLSSTAFTGATVINGLFSNSYCTKTNLYGQGAFSRALRDWLPRRILARTNAYLYSMLKSVY
jgi:hypothetical protein